MTSPLSPTSRRCRQCGCTLSTYNSDDVCSPCRTTEITKLYQHPSTIRTAEDLERHGFAAYRQALGVDTAAALQRAVDNRLLPLKMVANLPKLAALVDTMCHVSHSEAARVLEVSRFTIASWRRRLGLINDEPSEQPDLLDLDEPVNDPVTETTPSPRRHPKSADRRVARPGQHRRWRR